MSQRAKLVVRVVVPRACIGLSVPCNVNRGQCSASFNRNDIEHRFQLRNPLKDPFWNSADWPHSPIMANSSIRSFAVPSACITQVSFVMMPLAVFIFQFDATMAVSLSITVRVGSIYARRQSPFQ